MPQGRGGRHDDGTTGRCSAQSESARHRGAVERACCGFRDNVGTAAKLTVVAASDGMSAGLAYLLGLLTPALIVVAIKARKGRR